jgi:hypothetical protein
VITVEGYLLPDRTPYAVAVGVDDDLAEVGCATGTPAALALLNSHNGQLIAVTPTGPTVQLDVTQPEMVVLALFALTKVTATSVQGPDGEVLEASGPVKSAAELIGGGDPDVVY